MTHWLDRHIEAQKGQREILDKLCFPYEPAELCELITEQDEREGETNDEI